VNTCARLESTSNPNRIACSKETAEELIKYNKSAWLEKRSDVNVLKEKGVLEAYWVNVQGERAGSVVSAYSSQTGKSAPSKLTQTVSHPGLDERTQRLVEWNVEMLTKILKEIGARRATAENRASSKSKKAAKPAQLQLNTGSTPLEEVKEIITLPEFDGRACASQVDPEQIEIPADVVAQLHYLVSAIATLYR